MTNMINALPFLKRVCKYQDFKSNIQQGFKNIFEGDWDETKSIII